MLLFPTWIYLLFLASKKFPSNTSVKQGRPASVLMEFTVKWGRQVLNKKLQVLILVTKVKCRGLTHLRQGCQPAWAMVWEGSLGRCCSSWDCKENGYVFQHDIPLLPLGFTTQQRAGTQGAHGFHSLWQSFIHSSNTLICSKAAKNHQILFLHACKKPLVLDKNCDFFHVQEHFIFFLIPSLNHSFT